MAPLATVEPQRARIVDHDRVNRNVPIGHASINRHEARLDTPCSSTDSPIGRRSVRDGGHGRAGAVKGGLGDGVVAGPELELHHGAGLGSEALGPELRACDVVCWVFPDVDDLDVDGWGV